MKDKKLMIVNSKNRSKGIGKRKKITLEVKLKDLPENTSKDDLVAAIKVNCEKEESKEKDKNFKARYLVPLLIPVVLAGAIKGCVNNSIDSVEAPNNTPSIQTINESINGQYYDIDSPYPYMEGLTNAVGQEGMTANAIHGDYIFDGKYYDANVQFENEERSSSGQEEFSRMEQEIDENMEKLTSSDATEKEKYEAAKKVLDINRHIKEIYTANLEFVEDEAEKFGNLSDTFKDTNTDAEKLVVKSTVDKYKENLGLTNENITTLSQIVQLVDEGYSIEISSKEDQREDYTITVDAIKKVAEEIGIDKKVEDTFNLFIGKEQIIDNKNLEVKNDAR